MDGTDWSVWAVAEKLLSPNKIAVLSAARAGLGRFTDHIDNASSGRRLWRADAGSVIENWSKA
jgi:hypothetical protein